MMRNSNTSPPAKQGGAADVGLAPRDASPCSRREPAPAAYPANPAGARPVFRFQEGWQDNVPEALKERDHWVLWKYVLKEGRWTKMPFCAHAPSDPASTTDPQTWNTFAFTVAAYEKGLGTSSQADGIGYVFSAEDPFAGVDFDRCLGPDGRILSWAEPSLGRLAGSYCEISPSGTGVKVIVAAELPGRGTKKTGFGPDGSGAIELYDRGRFFTITGDASFPDRTTPLDCRDAITDLYRAIAPRATSNGKAAPSGPPADGDDALLGLAFAAKNGQKVRDLFEGRYDARLTHSEADFRLCCHLAFWFNRDAAAIDRVFRTSALMRDKWDSPRSDSTYGAYTIDNAIAVTDEVYTPRPARGPAADAPPAANGQPTPAADGQAPEPTPEPIDVAALRKRAGEFQKLSDLTDDVGWLDALARLEVTDPDEANRILTFAQDVLGKKKWAAKPVKIALAGPRKAARRLDAPRETPQAGLPEILVDRPIHEVIADAVEALAGDPEVFQRGPNLVRMIRNEKPPKGLKGTEGTPQIAPIPATRLIELLSRSARWVKERMNNDGEPILIATDPTGLHAGLVKDRCDWPGIRVLERVTEAPCLRPDGTLLQTPGYDPDTGLFFLPHPGVTFPEVPEHPTIADARAAAKTLLDLVVDFPFARPEGKEEEESPHTYAWLASLLTILCRSAIDGPCPLFLFTANTAGSGKTKLCDLIALIATGRKMPRSDYTDNNEEMAKVLFSIALGGFPVVFLDNVGSGGALGGSAIDKALTSTALNGRILGASEMRDVPFHAVLFATGNNVRLQGDIHRRLVPCRLESPDEHPEERDEDAFQLKGDLEEHTLRNRPALVAAGLTIVRAYVVAGKPKPKLTPMDFPAWATLIRNAIHWATGFDPCATRAEARDDDDSAHELAQLMTGWQVVCAGEGKDSMTTGEMLKAVKPDPATKTSRYEAMHEVLVGMSRNEDLPSGERLGLRLKKYRGKVVGKGSEARAFERSTLHGKTRWSVKPIARHGPPKEVEEVEEVGVDPATPRDEPIFSPQMTTVIDSRAGEKKILFRGDQWGQPPPPPPPPPPDPDVPCPTDTLTEPSPADAGMDGLGPTGLTEPPCGGCWRMDCPWCTPSDDDASEGGAR